MSVLRDFFDEARGVFRDVIDFERFKFELSLAKEARAAEAETARAQAPVMSSGSINPMIVIGGLVAAGLLAVALIRR